MKIRAYIMFLLCLFQVSIYAQESAQVTLTIRFNPIQTIEVNPLDMQILEVSNQEEVSSTFKESYTSHQLNTFSTYLHAVRVDSVRNIGFEALRTIRDSSPNEDKSINHIFSDTNYYYKDGDEDTLNVVYCMETL